MAGVGHAAAFALRMWLYYEWVESKSNWADGIRRDGFRGIWFRRHRFCPVECIIPPALLDLPFPALVAVFEFL